MLSLNVYFTDLAARLIADEKLPNFEATDYFFWSTLASGVHFFCQAGYLFCTCCGAVGKQVRYTGTYAV
jgi:hypothetical protein